MEQKRGIEMKLTGKRILCVFFILICFISSACGTAATSIKENNKVGKKETSYEVTDYKGTKVKLEKKPVRILTTSSVLDVILLGLVDAERMVAVKSIFAEQDYESVKHLLDRIPNSISRNPSVETMAGLKPDLILVSDWVPMANIEILRDLGIPVVVCHQPTNIKSAKETISMVASIVGEEENGIRLIKMMDDKLAEIRAKVDKIPAEKKGKSVAVVALMAGYGGKGCVVDDYCALTDCVNAKAAAGNKHGQPMTKEQFLACNPDFIFLPRYPNRPEVNELYGSDFYSDPSFAEMKAIKTKNIRRPRTQYIFDVSQNVVFGVQETARMIYGDDLFAQPDDCFLTAVPANRKNK